MQDTRPALPVSTALYRGSNELRGLKLRLESLEHHLEDIFEASELKLESDVISSLQEFDLIVQSAEALADFLKEIAEQPDLKTVDICTINAVGTIRLRDLANRLTGTDSKAGLSGSPELF